MKSTFLKLIALALTCGNTSAHFTVPKAEEPATDNTKAVYSTASLDIFYKKITALLETKIHVAFTQEEAEELKQLFSQEQTPSFAQSLNSDAIRELIRAIKFARTSINQVIQVNFPKQQESINAMLCTSNETGTLPNTSNKKLVITISGQLDELNPHMLKFFTALATPQSWINLHGGKLIAGTIGIGLITALGLSTATPDAFYSLASNPRRNPQEEAANTLFFVKYFRDYAYGITTGSYGPNIRPLAHVIGINQGYGIMKGGLSYGPNGDAEGLHDWVQLVFPTEQVSSVHATHISNASLRARFRERQDLRNALENAFRFYLNFMGLKLTRTYPDIYRPKIVPLDDKPYRTGITNFLTNTHNFQRATRIIKSLVEHGLPEDALLFYNYLMSIPDTLVPRASISRWIGAPTHLGAKDYFFSAIRGKEVGGKMKYPKAIHGEWRSKPLS